MTCVMTVHEPGMFTTVQDLGRPGLASQGVPESGAADALSLRVGNRLLGNPDAAAALECTLRGPTVSFSRDTWICVTGATSAPFNAGVPTLARAGVPVALGGLERGARAYLCVQGGLDVPRVMGSAATLVRAGLGGFQGRALRGGDVIGVGEATGAVADAGVSKAASTWLAGVLGRRTVRVVAGLHADLFSSAARAMLAEHEFMVSDQSDRIGVRLSGPVVSGVADGVLLSEGTAVGSIQIPGDGQPIVLGVDRPTTGGYPVIACVIAADLPVLGSLRPRERVRFAWVPIDQAWRVWQEQEAMLDRLVPELKRSDAS
jgi:biotin-dependent carboxylase-like uncharacterized protein